MSNQPIATICRICKENCGILVSHDGHSTKISGNPQHPISRGFICVKGKNFGDVHNSPHRLRTPMLKKGSDWVSISYEEAIDILAQNFDRAKEKFGAQSVVFYKGESVKHQEITQYMRHLAYGYGSPNYISVGSLCHYSMVMGHSLTYGGIPKPDFQRDKTILAWGANPANASPLLFVHIQRATREGTKMVVVDPAATKTARLADCHLPITPGSDGLLALALIKRAIEDVSLAPADNLSTGWHALREMVTGFSYDELLAKTGIDSLLFDKAASLIFSNLPGWVLTGLGLELQPGGVQAIRAVACLQSLIGPSNRPFPMSASLKDLPGRDTYPPMPAPVGALQAPMYVQMKQEGQGMFLSDAILLDDPYPVRAMLVVGGNPMSTFPFFSLQKKALNGLDFLAVFDLFMTETAQLADLVLPASDSLGNLELHDYGQAGHPYLGLIRPAASSPIGWPTWKLLFTMARRFGLERLFPWEDNSEAIDYRLSACRMKIEDLEQSPGAVLPYEVESAFSDRWHTPDGRVQYRSGKMEAFGYPGIPDPECFRLPTDTGVEFPLWLSTGDRILVYQHSQYRQIPAYRNRAPQPLLDLHPEAAAKLGVVDGDAVLVVTRYGRLEIGVNLTDEVRRDCIRIVHGWDEANVNELTGLEHFDPVSGFPWLRAIPARLEKKGK